MGYYRYKYKYTDSPDQYIWPKQASDKLLCHNDDQDSRLIWRHYNTIITAWIMGQGEF